MLSVDVSPLFFMACDAKGPPLRESKLYIKSRTTSNKYLPEMVDFLKKITSAPLGHFLYLPLAISRQLSYYSCTEMNFTRKLHKNKKNSLRPLLYHKAT